MWCLHQAHIKHRSEHGGQEGQARFTRRSASLSVTWQRDLMTNIKVTVTQGIRVVGPDGTVYQNGETATVHERVARRWITNGWASDTRVAGTLPDPRGLCDVSEGLASITAEPSADNDAEPEPAGAKVKPRADTRSSGMRQARRDPRKLKKYNDNE
jgi:hypothetical protein